MKRRVLSQRMQRSVFATLLACSLLTPALTAPTFAGTDRKREAANAGVNIDNWRKSMITSIAVVSRKATTTANWLRSESKRLLICAATTSLISEHYPNALACATSTCP